MDVGYIPSMIASWIGVFFSGIGVVVGMFPKYVDQPLLDARYTVDAIAAAAKIGDRRMPKAGYSAPAATGISAAL